MIKSREQSSSIEGVIMRWNKNAGSWDSDKLRRFARQVATDNKTRPSSQVDPEAFRAKKASRKANIEAAKAFKGVRQVKLRDGRVVKIDHIDRNGTLHLQIPGSRYLVAYAPGMVEKIEKTGGE